MVKQLSFVLVLQVAHLKVVEPNRTRLMLGIYSFYGAFEALVNYIVGGYLFD